MKQENKRCWGCGYFRAYYTMGYCCLMKENNGYCVRHNKVTEKCDGCDAWYCRRIPKERRAKIAMRSLPEIYKKVAVIELILQDDEELSKMRNETDNK